MFLACYLQQGFLVQNFMHDTATRNNLQTGFNQRNEVNSFTRGINILVKMLYHNVKEKTKSNAYLFA